MQELALATEAGGRVAFVLGPKGSGKTACLELFQELVIRKHGDVKIGYADCSLPHPDDPTWTHIADTLTRGERLKQSAKTLAAPWLNVLPIIGPVLAAIAGTVDTVTKRRGGGPKKPVPRAPSDASAVAAVRALLEYGPLKPRLLILDSLDRGDGEDVSGVFALLRQLDKTRTLLVASARTTHDRPPSVIYDAILESERYSRARRIELPALSASEIAEAVLLATSAPVPEAWLARLVEESLGNPGELWSLLGALQDAGHLRRAGRRWEWVGDPAAWRGPSRASGDESMPTLSDGDRRLLALAALEGTVFHSAVLAQVANLSELDVEDRLARLRRMGVLEYRGEEGDGDDLTGVYAFRSAQEAVRLARELPEQDRAQAEARLEGVRGHHRRAPTSAPGGPRPVS